MMKNRTRTAPLALAAVGLTLIAGVATAREAGVEEEPEGFSAKQCLAWVGETYRVGELAAELELDLEEELEANLACMKRDTEIMAKPIPLTWCDNVFKIHCGGLDLLAVVGDDLLAHCEAELTASLNVDVGREKSWVQCAQDKLFDGYSKRGEPIDHESCRRVLVEECGVERDA